MLLTFRPCFGFEFPGLILSLLALSALVLSACAPPAASPDTWKLTPPKIGIKNATGAQTKVSVSDLQAFSTVSNLADASSELEFAPQDRDMPVVFKTRCSSGDVKTEEHIQTLVTSARVPLAKIAPPMVASANDSTQDWFCDIRMTVTNRHGTQSSGTLRGVRVNLATALRISVIKSELLIPNTNLENFFHRPLFSWAIRNDEPTEQVVFLNAKTNSIQSAVATSWKGLGHILLVPLSIRPKFTSTGVLEERQTGDGYYFRLAAGTAAIVTMHSNCPVNYGALIDFKLETSHITVELEAPLMLSALSSDRKVPSFSMAPEADLRAIPRQNVSTKPLLTSTVFERDPLRELLKPSQMTVVQLGNTVKKHPGSACIVLHSSGLPMPDPCQ